MYCFHLAGTAHSQGGSLIRLLAFAPTPGIAEPQRRDKSQVGGIRSPVHDANADADVFEVPLRVLHENVKVAALLESVCIVQLELAVEPRTLPVLSHKLRVGKPGLRILVESFQVRSGGSRI